MQKYAVILFFFCASTFLFLHSCKKESGLLIQGEISNIQAPYILASYVQNDSLKLDTIPVNEFGKFTYLHSKIDTLTTFTLHFNNYSSSVVFFAEDDEKLTLEGDATIPDLIFVNGNEINDDLTRFKHLNADLLRQRGQLLSEIAKEREDDDSLALPVLASKDRLSRINSLNNELTQKAEEFIKANPTKISSLVLINDFFVNAENPQGLDRVLKYIEGNVLYSPITTRLKTYSEKVNMSAEGMRHPAFSLIDSKDKDVKSTDLRGKYIVLSFVSAAGEDSRESIRELRKAYSKLGKDSVAFISIYIDTDDYPISYVKNDSITWTIVPEKEGWASEIVDLYNIPFVPYNIFISPAGLIKERNIPSQEIQKAIANEAAQGRGVRRTARRR